MFLAMPMTPEVRQKWTEARKAKDYGAEDSSGEASGSLAQMRAIMLDVSTPLWPPEKIRPRESACHPVSRLQPWRGRRESAGLFARSPVVHWRNGLAAGASRIRLVLSQEVKGSPAALIEIVSRPAWPTAKKDGGTASRIRLAPAVSQAKVVRGPLASAEDWEHLAAATRSG